MLVFECEIQGLQWVPKERYSNRHFSFGALYCLQVKGCSRIKILAKKCWINRIYCSRNKDELCFVIKQSLALAGSNSVRRGICYAIQIVKSRRFLAWKGRTRYLTTKRRENSCPVVMKATKPLHKSSKFFLKSPGGRQWTKLGLNITSNLLRFCGGNDHYCQPLVFRHISGGSFGGRKVFFAGQNVKGTKAIAGLAIKTNQIDWTNQFVFQEMKGRKNSHRHYGQGTIHFNLFVTKCWGNSLYECHTRC